MALLHFFNYARRIIITLLGVVALTYLSIILLSYVPTDPSWTNISNTQNITNMGGETGAWISGFLVAFFGKGVWFALLFVLYEVVLLWWQRKVIGFQLRLVAYVFLLFSLSASLAMYSTIGETLIDGDTGALNISAVVADDMLGNGGIIGYELAVRLQSMLTEVLSWLFLAVFVGLTTSFVFDLRWKQIFSSLFLSKSNRKKQDLQDQNHQNEAHHDNNDSYAIQSETNSPFLDQDPDDVKPYQAKTSKDKALQQRLLRPEVSSAHLTDAEDTADQEQLPLNFANQKNQYHDLESERVTDELSEEDNDLEYYEEDPHYPKDSVAHDAEGYADEADYDDEYYEGDYEDDYEDDDYDDEGYDDKPVTDSRKAFNHQVANHYDNDAGNGYHNNTPPQRDYQEDALPEEYEYEETLPVNEDVETSERQELYFDYLNDAQNDEYVPQNHGNNEENVQDSTWFNYDGDQPQAEDNGVIDREEDAINNALLMNYDDVDPIIAEKKNLKNKESLKNLRKETMIKLGSSFKTMLKNTTKSDDEKTVEQDDKNDKNNRNKEVSKLPDISDDKAFKGKSRAFQTAKHRKKITSLPKLSLLDKPDPSRKPSYTKQELEELSRLLETKLQEFNILAEVVSSIPGPVVTRFEVQLAPGVKVAKVVSVSRDLARSLSMASLRVVEIIPGKPYIGIEIPNKQREMVRLIELLKTDSFRNPDGQISMAMGKDISGKAIITDLAKAPHMLVAGTTGSGKSVLVNSMLLSMLLKYKPADLRLILIDPKQLELANYNDIPHLLTPVVTDMTEAAGALSWCVAEMEKRYLLMSLLKVRKLKEFNKKIIEAEQAGNPIIDPLWRANDSVSVDKAPKLKPLPMIVIVADEFADMIMQVGKQAEELITRLAQKSRASGIHLMLATQRPSVDVITGLIKANVPVRAALRVNSKVDSRTILDKGGAEDMLGNGDMLFLGPGQIEAERVHGAFVSDEEVNRVCEAWRERGFPDYIENLSTEFQVINSDSGSSSSGTSGEDDAFYNEAVAFILETRKVSASSIQRKFSIGYNRAARIVDSMEQAGIVSPMIKGKREILR